MKKGVAEWVGGYDALCFCSYEKNGYHDARVLHSVYDQRFFTALLYAESYFLSAFWIIQQNVRALFSVQRDENFFVLNLK